MEAIPPVGPSHLPIQPGDQLPPQVQQFYQLWTDWWNNPNRDTADAVIQFLKNPKNEAIFQQLAKLHPAPDYSKFLADYQAGIKWMQNWIETGCKATPAAMNGPSEMLHNIYLWAHGSES